MGYGLASKKPEEIAYYKKIKDELRQDGEEKNMSISKADYFT